jgi:hypothetical protein
MLGNEHLDWCTEVRDLGVLVDHKLLFNQHTANIIHEARVRARKWLCPVHPGNVIYQ